MDGTLPVLVLLNLSLVIIPVRTKLGPKLPFREYEVIIGITNDIQNLSTEKSTMEDHGQPILQTKQIVLTHKLK